MLAVSDTVTSRRYRRSGIGKRRPRTTQSAAHGIELRCGPQPTEVNLSCAVREQRVSQPFGQTAQLGVGTELAVDGKTREVDAVGNIPLFQRGLAQQVTHHVAGALVPIE